MDYWVLLLILFAAPVALGLWQRFGGGSAESDRGQSPTGLVQPTRLSPADRAAGLERAKRIEGRSPGEFVRLAILPRPSVDYIRETYRAAYELIIRGLQVRLEMFEVYQERGGGTLGLAVPQVTPRVSYTTEAFLPHLGSIRSMDDFARYAPYRANHQMTLDVHSDDLNETYQVLRLLAVGLSETLHPNQS